MTRIHTIVAIGGIAAGLLGCPTTEAPAPTVDLELELFHFSIENEPWEGVEVCVEDTDTCATSDADGLATVTAPEAAEVVLLLDGDATFPPHAIPVATQTADQWIPLYTGTVDLVANIYESAGDQLGTTLDPAGGYLAVNVRGAVGDTENDVAAVTASITPDDGQGPLYTNEFGLIDDSTETSVAGAIFYFDAPEGTYTVALAHATRTCTHWLAWPGDADDEVRAPLRDGRITQASPACPE